MTHSRLPTITMLTTAALSALLLVAAMHVYPGGTQWDHATAGNDFWRNYLCDLARTVALNGAPNPLGSALARASLSVLAVGLVPFFVLLTRLFSSRARLGAVVRGLAYVTAPTALVVVLLPADRFSPIHGLATLVSGGVGITATLLATVGLVLERPCPRLVTAAALITLASAVAGYVPFVRQSFVEGPGPVAAAIFERLSFLCLLAWMAIVAMRPDAFGERTRARGRAASR